MARDLVDSAIGAMLGTMVGDAMGMPAKGLSINELRSDFGRIDSLRDGDLPAGEYTDETEMTVGICSALIDRGEFDLQAVAHGLAHNFTPWRGYSSHVYGIMARIRQGHDWETLGSGSWGNGAAVRVAPLAVLYAGDAALIEATSAQARITHNHPNGIAGAIVQALAISEAVINGIFESPLEPDELIERLQDNVGEHSVALSDALDRVREFRRFPAPEALSVAITKTFSCDETAIGSIPAALTAFLYSGSFEDTVIAAVNCGGDTDALGALAGGLAGAFWGASAIPERLTAGLANDEEGRDHVVRLGEALGQLTRRRSGERLEPSLEDELEVA